METVLNDISHGGGMGAVDAPQVDYLFNLSRDVTPVSGRQGGKPDPIPALINSNSIANIQQLPCSYFLSLASRSYDCRSVTY